MTRESYTRKSFYRKENIAVAKTELSELVDETEKMLKTFLPTRIVKELMIRQETEETNEIADHFDCASVLFTDMKGFTKYSSKIEPSELVLFLNQMYQKFDRITNRTASAQTDHAARAAYSALKMLEAIEEMKREDPKLKQADVKIRIGIHSDKVVAGVVGIKDPRYHLFGTTPQIANFMESEGVPSMVQCSKQTYDSLMNEANYAFAGCEYTMSSFKCEKRKEGVDLTKKGFDVFETYFIKEYQGELPELETVQ